ncbi:MAG: S9 family peptidase [Muribaculaceae bacterium]|nr:S9 family peptidase [Muribaculaceae bacterium]
MSSRIKSGLIVIAASLFAFYSNAEKKKLGHDDFDKWQKVTNNAVSNNGEWAVFAVNPQEGDGTLTFQNTVNSKKIDIERGYDPAFTADSKWGVALIKPLYNETRTAKIAKKKDLELPQDSLAIINLSTGEIIKKPNVASYKIGKEGGDWIAWISVDTLLTPKKVLDDKKAGKTLVLRHLPNGLEKTLPHVSEYLFSDTGLQLSAILKKTKKDSLSFNGIGIFMLPDTSFRILGKDMEFYGGQAFERQGAALAFIASADSVENGTKKAALYLAKLSDSKLEAAEIGINSEITNSGKLYLNQYSKPEFSYNGKRLVVGVAPPVAPDDTTLVDFEKASLDIWRWNAPFTPPQENHMVDRIRKQTFPVVIDLASGNQVLVTDNPLVEVATPNRWDGNWALLEDKSEHIISEQWDYQFPVQLSVKNISTGETRQIVETNNVLTQLSPADRYVLWFTGRNYYCHDITKGTTKKIATDIAYPLWDEDQDNPLKEREPYGVMGWTDNDAALLVYDKYDVWCVDPNGINPSICITAGEGRKTDVRYRYIQTDREKRWIKKGERLLYSLFDLKNKYGGFAYSDFSEKSVAPKTAMLEPNSFKQVKQGKNSGTYTWIKANFSVSPNVYYTRDIAGKGATRVTDSNPQMGDYSWGTAQLFKWYAYDGKPSEGVLYLPEDFDPEKEYPMIAYFYEIYSDMLFNHFDMEPSWSWINIPFYVSRGYVVFLPDIHYTAGVPGECAYNYVCSGVEEVCRQFPNINKNKIGIDGQSWGGYQTAYLVTRTNMFACAGSGAPVSNMSSAFGGIRWESGSSRQAQYEVGQSRIGRNLWESPQLYLANSPVFYADRVETPLLIMHNDADGAVPWYQGIEMFMALRRLGKPVWMLQYNSEAHNLRERRNRKDITKRLQQFFDHYLMDAPMPEWMKNGIPAIRKGQEYGY